MAGIESFQIIAKPEVNLEDFFQLNACLYAVYIAVVNYAEENSLPICITSIATDLVKNRTSWTHVEFRGMDLSIEGWSELHINRVCFHINDRFKEWKTGKLGKKKEWTVIKCHKAKNGKRHLHLQVNRLSSLSPGIIY